MSDPSSSPPLPFRPPKASSRIAERAALFGGTVSSSPPQASSSRIGERGSSPENSRTLSATPRTPSRAPRDSLATSPASSLRSSSAHSSPPSPPTPLRPLPSSTTTTDSPSTSTDLASHLANLSIADSAVASSPPPPPSKGLDKSPARTSSMLLEPDSPSQYRSGVGVAQEGHGAVLVSPPQGGGHGNGSKRLPSPPPREVSSQEEGGGDELALLVVSSSITELFISVQEVNTLIFEIQELRHTTAAAPPPPPLPSSASSTSLSSQSTVATAATDAPSPLSDVDAALMKLESRLDAVRTEYATVEAQVKPLLATAPRDASGELGFVQQKWGETQREWEGAQQDAEQLSEEFKEDKFVLVFRTVVQQAEDMCRSLEKIVTQSERFVQEATSRSGSFSNPPRSPAGLPRSPSGLPPTSSSSSSSSLLRSPSVPLSSYSASTASNSSSYFSDSAVAQSQLASFSALHKSLTAKVKYYSPACDRVLKILEKGISDRSTKNGEVLRRYGEMKTRWRNVRERIQRVQAEMRAVEEELKEQAGYGNGRSAQYGSMLTPPRSDGTSPGRVSPLRRLANKMSPRSGVPPALSSTSSRPPHIPTSASSPNVSTLRTSTSSSSIGPTPPRPPKSSARFQYGDSHGLPSTSSTPPQTPQRLNHRRSQSAISVSVPSSASTSTFGTRSVRPSRRGPSPTPSSGEDNRPRWNISTRRTEEERETLNQSALGSSRPSLGGAYPPSASRSGRHSSMGLRPSSRMSLSSSMSRSFGPGRPVSPAFSDASSAYRDRPMTPGSRIPMPSPALKRSTTPFSSLDDPEPSSLLQRAMSPTPPISGSPSSSRIALSRSSGPSNSSSRSRLPTPGVLSPPRAISPAFSSSSSAYYRGGHTPEPSLAAQAQRLAHVRAPLVPVARPPPVPRVPSAYRTSLDPQTTPRASNTGTFGGPRPSTSRPSSSLSTSRYGGAHTPLPSSGANSSAQLYAPNPLDPLDTSVASVLTTLPLLLHVTRVDPPLTRVQAAQAELFSARYIFSLHPLEDTRRAVMCKLVDRVGPRARKGEKKVLVRIGGGWQDLETHLLSLIAMTI